MPDPGLGSVNTTMFATPWERVPFRMSQLEKEGHPVQQSIYYTRKSIRFQVPSIPRDVRQPICMPRYPGYNQEIPGTYSANYVS